MKEIIAFEDKGIHVDKLSYTSHYTIRDSDTKESKKIAIKIPIPFGNHELNAITRAAYESGVLAAKYGRSMLTDKCHSPARNFFGEYNDIDIWEVI